MTDWHDDARLWRELGPVMFTEQRWHSAPEEVAGVVDLTSVPAGGSVLDLGCGPGRHSLAFAGLGFRVTSVDRTADYLDEARRRAREASLTVEWVEADMRGFRRPDTFDLAVNLLTSFGYFTDPVDDRRIIENAFVSLKPGGSFLLDIMGKEILARIFQRRDWQEQPDGTILLEERSVSEDWGRLDLRWIVLRDYVRHEHRFHLRLFAATELKQLFSSVGFEDVCAYGSFSGAPYDQSAERLIVAGRRPR